MRMNFFGVPAYTGGRELTGSEEFSGPGAAQEGLLPGAALSLGWLLGMHTRRGMSVLRAASLGAGMKGRRVAERGQQKPGQPLAQAGEELWPQAGVWME
ncbi:hypothetical protein P7K49_001299, partial [Saguinus oedipus]